MHPDSCKQNHPREDLKEQSVQKDALTAEASEQKDVDLVPANKPHHQHGEYKPVRVNDQLPHFDRDEEDRFDDGDESIRFTIAIIEDSGIKLAKVNEMPGFAELARQELRL